MKKQITAAVMMLSMIAPPRNGKRIGQSGI